MKFVYDGDYGTFMGIVFAYRKPVDVTNQRVIDELLMHPQYRRYEDGEEIKTSDTEAAPVPIDAPYEHICPKCGGEFHRGMTMHLRYCKGMQ